DDRNVRTLDRGDVPRAQRPGERQDRPAQPLEPGVESVRIAETGQLSPGDHQRLLYGVLGPIDIPKDPLGDGHEPVATHPGHDGERLPITTLCLLDEIAIQPIVLSGVRWGAPSDSTESRMVPRVRSFARAARYVDGARNAVRPSTVDAESVTSPERPAARPSTAADPAARPRVRSSAVGTAPRWL